MPVKVIAGALGLALFASSAWAQSETPPPPPPPGGMPGPAIGGMAPPPPPGDMVREGRGGPRGGMRHGPRDGRDGPPPPPPSRAAEFNFRRGPLEIKVRCAEEEPIKPCADAALTLMDKFAAVAGTIGDLPPPPPPKGAQPPPEAPAPVAAPAQ